jgi:glycerophosphoryl diester phosphodiesterase
VEPAVGVDDPFAITPERWLISHRGGPKRYPEEGMRGYDASAAAGFALEGDARQLGDGTWVMLHDATVDRTMTGVTGAVEGLTLAQWKAARLRPAPFGRFPDDPPITVVDFLQRQAGSVPILLELKGGDADGFIDTVRTTAGAHLPSVMVQSFDFAVAQRFAEAGLTPMFLMGAQVYPTTQTIVDSGIRYVGVARTMDAESVSQLRAAGLVVVSYTVNTGQDLDAEFREGVNGIFTDDAWRMSIEAAFTPVSATISRRPQQPAPAATAPAGAQPESSTQATVESAAAATPTVPDALPAPADTPGTSVTSDTRDALDLTSLAPRLAAMVWGSTDPGVLVDGAATWSQAHTDQL